MSDTKLLSLSEIFNNKIFRIPDFQRGYSWEERQLEDFWEDIQNLSPNKIHYIGLLTVEPIKKDEIINVEKWKDDLWLLKKGMSAYYVIDGQQRLTTLIILLHEILRTFKDDEGINFGQKSEWIDRFLYRSYNQIYKSFVFGYEKDNPSDEYFKTKILEQDSSAADKYPETLYTANLMFAKEYFAKKLKDLSKECKEEIFDKAVNRLKFNYYEIDDSLDVYVTFETMNNRGKDLSHLELLKNRLIYLSTLLHEDDETKERLRKDINETWKTIYEYLGKNKENPLDDDVFLFNHWVMYFTYDRSQSDVYAEFLLKKKFTSKNVLCGNISIEDIKAYIDSLSKCVKQWFYIFNIQYSNFSDKIKGHIHKLERVGWGAFPPMIMAVFTKERNEELIWDFLDACERFNFLVFAVSHRSSNTQNSNLYRKAREYYIGNLDLETLIHDIDFLTDGEENGNYYGWFDLERFRNHINELFSKNDREGFYSWSGLRYFLYEYELYLQDNANTKVTWEDFNKRKKEETIEHIYPQSATDIYWKKRFGNLKPTEKRLYLNSLGNLLLLSRSKNSKLQNYDFDKKKCLQSKDGKDIGYYNGSYSEIEVSKRAEWTTKEIIGRGLSMLQFMEERWNFKFKDWGLEKEEILFPTK
ncbi:DUF262 domain-containing protein [Coprobacter fastidiosus]|uniref:DUF262 domain-containing protein n=1 Tax=Coprobacter fastidiosus TaxID=1099853 RepID=UPI00189F07D6|nr:DUF262 domain-containing protein [Coprobacter fastidiosus]UWG83514.1 MAG: Protein of unknown function DUF262 [Bacteriophage sp.]